MGVIMARAGPRGRHVRVGPTQRGPALAARRPSQPRGMMARRAAMAQCESGATLMAEPDVFVLADRALARVVARIAPDQ